MADLEDDDLDLKPADAGALFRAEMWATNAILGYWKHLLAVLIVGLLCFLFYGQYQSYVQRTQRAATSMISDVEAELPAPLQILAAQSAAGILEIDAEELTDIGDRLTEVGRIANPPAKTEALLKAAEVFRIAGASDQRRAALQLAAEGAEGVLRFAVEGALADLELEVGEGDAAVDRLKALMEGEGFLAQQAALDLGLALEQLDRSDEAVEIYDEFMHRWPDSARTDQVRERRSRVSG